jgi:predicted HAD superfamily Cof-like phosphohydrolase
MPQAESDHLIKAMTEEINEFEDATRDGDFIGAIDGLSDLIYFALGGLYKMGLTEEMALEIFTAIHMANMEKKKGVIARRATGAPDAIKPEDWTPPEARIASILDRHMLGLP